MPSLDIRHILVIFSFLAPQCTPTHSASFSLPGALVALLSAFGHFVPSWLLGALAGLLGTLLALGDFLADFAPSPLCALSGHCDHSSLS